MVVLCRDSQPDSGLVSRQNPVRETVSHLVSLSRSGYMYNTWMQKFVEDRCFFFFHVMYFISQDSLMASTERKRGEKKTGPALHQKPGKEQRRRHSAMNRSQGGVRCGRSIPLRLEEEEETGGRAEERVKRRFLSVVSGFVASSTVHLLALLPLSLPGLIGRSVGM